MDVERGALAVVAGVLLTIVVTLLWVWGNGTHLDWSVAWHTAFKAAAIIFTLAGSGFLALLSARAHGVH
jgi:hypothetical protein